MTSGTFDDNEDSFDEDMEEILISNSQSLLKSIIYLNNKVNRASFNIQTIFPYYILKSS